MCLGPARESGVASLQRRLRTAGTQQSERERVIRMNSCKITIQRNVGEQWPVVLEQRTAGQALEIRTVGLPSLDVTALSVQITPRDYGVMLGQALFQGKVRDAFLHACAQSEDPLSVQLFVEAPDLSPLRWERLCAPLDEQWHFLAHVSVLPSPWRPRAPPPDGLRLSDEKTCEH
jgi:hypothetical protein